MNALDGLNPLNYKKQGAENPAPTNKHNQQLNKNNIDEIADSNTFNSLLEPDFIYYQNVLWTHHTYLVTFNKNQKYQMISKLIGEVI